MTTNYWQICIANFLLYLALYMLLPLLPAVMMQQVPVSGTQMTSAFLLMLLGMLVVGPFHAYLGDTYKRKYVLITGLLGVALTTVGYLFVDSYARLLCLTFLQGAFFGIAINGGVTIEIDITTSRRRSLGNMVYALAACAGMTLGLAFGIWLYHQYGFKITVAIAVFCCLLSIYLVSHIYVAFRAPIGLRLLSIDRFILPRAWVLAVNVVLVGAAVGMLVPLMMLGNWASVIGFAVVSALMSMGIGMFVKMAYHCQRGTANTMAYLSLQVGTLLGVVVSGRMIGDSCQSLVGSFSAALALIAVILFLVATYPYFRHKKVR